MNRGSNLRPRVLVVTWDHEPFSEPVLRRDLQRLRAYLANPEQQPTYETGVQSDFVIVPVDERSRTWRRAVPAAWQGVVQDPLYRSWLNVHPTVALDPDVFPPDEDPSTQMQRVMNFLDKTEPTPAQGPRINAPIEVLSEERRLSVSPLAPPGAVDPVAEAGESKITPGYLPVVCVWPGWWDHLLPSPGPALEAACERVYFNTAVRDAQNRELRAALAQAESRLAERSALVTTASEAAFWSIVAEHEGEEGALIKAEVEYGIEAKSLGELAASSAFQERLCRPTPVLMVSGWLGYMWWEFARDLRRGYVPRTCENCGSVILPRGRRDRRYCTQEENDACWRERNRNRTRRSRERSAG